MTIINEGWELTYTENQENEGNRRRSRRRTSSTDEIAVESIVRKSDGLIIKAGDLILVSELKLGTTYNVPALVHSFRYDSDTKKVDILTYKFYLHETLPSKLANTTLDTFGPNEVFASADDFFVGLDAVEGSATINEPSNASFVCNRIVDTTKNKISDKVDWSGLYEQVKSKSMDSYRDLLAKQLKKRPTKNSTPIKRVGRDAVVKNEEASPTAPLLEQEIALAALQKISPEPSTNYNEDNEPVLTPKAPRTMPETPSKKKRKLNFSTPTKSKQQIDEFSLPTRSPVKRNLFNAVPDSPQKKAGAQLHASRIPDQLPCRDSEFSQIFLALESAISTDTGSCIYISGTPGTGKTATIREVIAQLELRVEEGELNKFLFVEINGMKLATPQSAYEILWEKLRPESFHLSSGTAMLALEEEFKSSWPHRPFTVVLMDELDQLITRNQGLMYNFFNWPSLPNSRLVVLAVANTMDLPERTLSNKISSRLGLTRIQFPGYKYEQLREIIALRLSEMPIDLIDKEAIEFAARKVAGVSGDARRALEICQRAFELADADGGSVVNIPIIKQAIAESTNSPLAEFLQSMALSAKVLLCAILARIRRSGIIESSLATVLQETETLVKLSPRAESLVPVLFPKRQIRMSGFLHGLNELVEAGVLVQQAISGERSANVRLSINEDAVKVALRDDPDVEGMI